jgi:hypothetical protein
MSLKTENIRPSYLNKDINRRTAEALMRIVRKDEETDEEEGEEQETKDDRKEE